MNSFCGRIIITTVFSLLAGIGLSSSGFYPDALAQFPNPVKEAKKRAEEEKKRVKEEEEKRLRELKEAEDKLKEEERRLKEEEEKRLREDANKLKEEEKRLKEEEERRRKEAEDKLREEKRLKEEEEKRIREEENKLKEEEKRLREEEEKRGREEEKRLKEEERNRLKAEKSRLREEEKEEGRRNEGAKASKGAAAGAPIRSDGLDVTILMKNGMGVFAPVDPSREFVNGEQFRVEYNSRLDGIVYFVNVDPKGVATVIYRDEVSYGKKYVHPAPEENGVIQFRGSSGVEVLKIIISPKEILELENALRESGGKMGTNMRQARDELQGYVSPAQSTGKSCTGLELSSGGAKVDCRELRVVSMAQDQGKISVAVDPKGGGTRPDSRNSARLSDGEVAVLEIRLKHVQ
jgi:flagellar biosynthesis GTPase FlhF